MEANRATCPSVELREGSVKDEERFTGSEHAGFVFARMFK